MTIFKILSEVVRIMSESLWAIWMHLITWVPACDHMIPCTWSHVLCEKAKKSKQVAQSSDSTWMEKCVKASDANIFAYLRKMSSEIHMNPEKIMFIDQEWRKTRIIFWKYYILHTRKEQQTNWVCTDNMKCAQSWWTVRIHRRIKTQNTLTVNIYTNEEEKSVLRRKFLTRSWWLTVPLGYEVTMLT